MRRVWGVVSEVRLSATVLRLIKVMEVSCKSSSQTVERNGRKARPAETHDD